SGPTAGAGAEAGLAARRLARAAGAAGRVDELVLARLEGALRPLGPFALGRRLGPGPRLEALLRVLELRLRPGPAFLLRRAPAGVGAGLGRGLGGADAAGLARRVRHGRARAALDDRRRHPTARDRRRRLDRVAGGQVLGPDVLGQHLADHPRADLLDRPHRQGPELERAIGEADQPVHG